MPEIEPLTRNRSISVRIAEQILAKIEAGEYPVGTRLPAELELARMFGVSRPSVREALRALQFVGYIDSVRGSCNEVVSSKPSIEAINSMPVEQTGSAVLDLFEARLRIEPHVVAVAAADPDLDKLAEAEALIDGMRLVASEPTLGAETDLGVHRALAAICRNPFLRVSALNLLDVVASPSFRASREEAWGGHVLPSIWASQHHDVTRAIRAGDSDGAANAAWTHVASSAANALTVLGDDDRLRERADRLGALLARGPESWPVTTS